MIVRVMGEGQYRMEPDSAGLLNEIDNAAVAALERGDEDEFRRLLEDLAQAVRERGQRLDDADLSPSDLIVPPSDLSLEEARELFTGEGLIPELPA
jgi:hypothetical protein